MLADTIVSKTRAGSQASFQYMVGLWVVVVFDLGAFLVPTGLEGILSAIHAILLILLSLSAMLRMWRDGATAVLSPLWYALLLTSVFYGGGVLFFNFANVASLDWVNRHYPVNGVDLLSVNLVVSVGLAILWTAATSVLALSPEMEIGSARSWRVSPVWLARQFFVVGFGVQYLLVIPYMWGSLPFILPGFFMLFVNVTYASVFLLAVTFHRSHGRDGRFLLPVACAAGILAGLLVTSKTWILLTFLFYFLGRFYASRRLRGLVAGGLLVFVAYLVVTPFVQFVRSDLVGQSVRDVYATTASWSDYLGGNYQGGEGIQWWFVRLSYVSPQAYAINEFKNGVPGETVIGGIGNLLLPRVFFPDKPVHQPGEVFSESYGGNANSSVSPGIFAEAYWNGGWPALIAVSISSGLLLGASHRFIVASIMKEDWVVLPLCVGLFLGLGQINGFFASVYVYQPIVLIFMQLGLYALILIFGPRKTKSSAKFPSREVEG